jgi:hypothetical protein
VKKPIIVAILFVMTCIGIYIYNISTRNRIDYLVEKKSMINVLIMGANKYNKNRMSFYAVVSINPENRNIGVTFLPPSLKVDISGDGDLVRLDQIDSRDFKGLTRYLYDSLNMKINGYISFYAPDVERFVNYIEGIDIYVVDQIKNQPEFKPGINYLDGNKIIRYINYSEDKTIYRKYDKIQDVLFTLYYARDKYSSLINKGILSELMKTYKTSISISEMYSILRLIEKKGDLFCTVIPGSISKKGDYVIDEVAYKIYESEFIKKLIIKKENDSNIKVKVLNASGAPGLAKKIRFMLVKEGISVVEFGTYAGTELEKSIVIDQSGNMESIKRISEITSVSTQYHIIDSSQMSNVVLIAGKDLTGK